MSINDRRVAAGMCAVIAILVGLTAALGVILRGDGSTELVTSVRGETYEMAVTGVYAYNAERVVAEGIGWDIVTLAAVVPAMLIAVPFAARGSLRGRLLAIGLLGYTSYMYLEYAVTWAFGPLFPLFVVILAASVVAIVRIASDVARDGLEGRFGSGFPRRSWAAISLAMGGLLTLMWAQRIVTSLGAEAPELLGETTMTVQALDLGLMIPASVLAAALVLRRSLPGYAFATAFVVTYVAMAAAITAMLLSAWAVTGTLEIVPVGIFAVALLAGIVVAVRAYRSVIPAPRTLELTLRVRAPAPAHG